MARPALSSDEVSAMRQRLLDAALDLYRAQGLEALSFRALAEAVGLSHTLAYRYFRHKEDLLTALRVQCTQQFEAFVRGKELQDGPVRERIRSVAMAYVGYVKLHPAEYQLIFSTHQPPPSAYPELLAARRRFFEHAVEVIRLGVAQGELEGDARELAHAFWAALHGLMTLHVANQLVHGRKLESLVEPLVTRLIGAPAAARTARTRRAASPRAIRSTR